jgi:hypothetical protein
MKKTLIALAVLAVSGAAFAQSTVTINGKLGAQYMATKSSAGAKTNGFNIVDGDVNFVMVEDLGGGLKASAFMGIRLRGREASSDGAVDGIGARNATISLSGGFGSVTAGAVAAGSGIMKFGTAGAVLLGIDDTGLLMDKEVNSVDLFEYRTRSMSGLTGYVQLVDSISDAGGGGMGKTEAAMSATVAGVDYVNGPVAFSIDTTKYNRNLSAFTNDTRLRTSASYDLGVAKLGLGYQTNDNTLTDVKQTLIGVNVPMGAFSIGLNWADRKTKTLATGLTAKNSGYEAGVNYALSKRTAIAASMGSIDVAGALNDQTFSRVRLMHSF